MRTRSPLPAFSLSLSVLAAPAALAHVDGRLEAPGALVGVTVEVEGRVTPLYTAPDGSGRYYVEARRGARYAVRVSNRSGERVGVVVAVDGLNAISGELEPAALGAPGERPGRMYVLDAWDDVTVRGWRTSLDEVRRFTFVDEERSYAARSERSNRKLGWIEVRVYRERRPYVRRLPWAPEIDDRRDGRGGNEGAGADSAAAPPAAKSAPSARAEAQEGGPALGGRRESYPGTGWGARENDPVTVVRFDPEPSPADTLSLRYEYRAALARLGVVPHRHPERDRLAERDAARDGFARPPVR